MSNLLDTSDMSRAGDQECRAMSSKAMSSQARIETALEALIARVEGDGTPPGLAAAVLRGVWLP